ncbi:MAG: oligosaccharide flippase family protein [Chitinophagales bacterium]|nr:oligosaccharide flippase family protein [Bacteroidota bacterium]MBP7398880.1 oligosaccharide flippase family protein [Chitinophagales bacterium]MBP8753787.1 oligosaccharide flippase family protein [Chitinophagales bacterium]MBP9189781.1 oligosaccharide flippase family protein [Chitinophagales bacterium]MBP9548302.1 oligosaccharide flippase family protein [Chitinophagales bacterium]
MLIGIILSKSGIAQSEIGNYETLLLLTGLTSFFWVNAVLSIYIQRFVKAENKNRLIDSTLLIFISISFLLSLLILLLEPTIRNTFDISHTLVLQLALLLPAQNISYFSEHYFLSVKKGKPLLILTLAHAILLPIIVLIIALTTLNITLIIWGIISFHLVKIIFTYVMYLFAGKPVADKAEVKSVLQLALPLGISFMLGGASIYVDGIIINTHFDKATFAMYQYGAREFPLAMILAGAVNLSMIGIIAANSITGISALKQNTSALMHKIFPAGILLMCISKFAFPVVFNPQFSESFIYFNIYLLLIIPRTLLPQSILMAFEKNNFLMWVSIIEFILNIVLSLLFLSLIGLPGVALGTVAAYIFEKIAFTIKLKSLHIAPKNYIPLPLFFIYSALLIITFIFTTLPYL